MFWPLLKVHPPQPNADGAGRHDNDPVAIFPQLHCRFHYRRQDREEGLMGFLVDNRASPWKNVSYTNFSLVPYLVPHSPSLITTPSGRGPLMTATCKWTKLEM